MSSIGRKFAMALSAFFLLIFILQHFSINLLSIINAEAFNAVSHFMGTNPVVQFVLQPVLIFGFLFHIVMGMVLDYRNRSSRCIGYTHGSTSGGATWMSKNMIITGVMVMLFLGLHMYDFWWHEIKVKYIQGDMSGLLASGEGLRYYADVVAKFESKVRVSIYVLAFVFLGLHLAHGFQSSFQSVGVNHPKYTPILKSIGNLFSVVIPIGFAIIALWHMLGIHPIF